MTRMFIPGVILASIVGCASDSNNENTPVTTVTESLFTGTWLKCENDDPVTSFSNTITFNGDGTGSATQVRFADQNCVTPDPSEADIDQIFTYMLGADVIVDGSVANITTATEFDLSINSTLSHSFY